MTDEVEFDIEDEVAKTVRSLDRKIEKIDEQLRSVEPLIEARKNYVAARRALLGSGSRTTNGTSQRLHMEDILGYLTTNPGATPSQIAKEFGVEVGTVTSHIYRNKDRFVKKGTKYYKRDPEAGINSEEDIED